MMMKNTPKHQLNPAPAVIEQKYKVNAFASLSVQIIINHVRVLAQWRKNVEKAFLTKRQHKKAADKDK
jgi:hypothetical protein